jgi:hypothetical protein
MKWDKVCVNYYSIHTRCIRLLSLIVREEL